MSTIAALSTDSSFWAAAYLADLRTRIRFVSRPVEERTEADGRTWREAFTITAMPGERFTIHLHAGASSPDLERARRVIAHAQSVGLDYRDRDGSRLWHRRERGDWFYRAWHLREQEGFDELRECNVVGCVEQWHEWVNGEQFMPCELEPIRTPGYLVTGYRIGGEWVVGASFNESDVEGHAGSHLIQDLANDYAWMQGECERLNAAARIVVGAARYDGTR